MMYSRISRKIPWITKLWNPSLTEFTKSHSPTNYSTFRMYWMHTAGSSSPTKWKTSKSFSLLKKMKSNSTKTSSQLPSGTWSSAKSSKTKSWWFWLNTWWLRVSNFSQKKSDTWRSTSKWSVSSIILSIMKNSSIK